MRKTILLSILVCMSLVFCNEEQGEHTIRSFYFPLEKLEDPHVYVYQTPSYIDRPPYYMIYRAEKKEDQYFLNSWSLDHNFLLQYTSREKAVHNGMLAESYNMLIIDSTGKVSRREARIESDNIFPFEKRDSNTLYVFEMTWYVSDDSSRHNTIIRNRWQKGPTEYIYNGETLPAWKMGIKEIIDQYDEGYLQYEARGEEIYAKNIGLVATDKSIGEDYRLAYELDTIYRLRDFEQAYEVDITLPDDWY